MLVPIMGSWSIHIRKGVCIFLCKKVCKKSALAENIVKSVKKWGSEPVLGEKMPDFWLNKYLKIFEHLRSGRVPPPLRFGMLQKPKMARQHRRFCEAQEYQAMWYHILPTSSLVYCIIFIIYLWYCIKSYHTNTMLYHVISCHNTIRSQCTKL